MARVLAMSVLCHAASGMLLGAPSTVDLSSYDAAVLEGYDLIVSTFNAGSNMTKFLQIVDRMHPNISWCDPVAPGYKSSRPMCWDSKAPLAAFLQLSAQYMASTAFDAGKLTIAGRGGSFPAENSMTMKQS
eukprot:Hpha_TRINITY_DN8008_c0_g1::TRINITY_DN8008_c0_g1_i2::g.140285::m.140285